METPEYVTVEEVRRVCRELGLRDWTALPTAAVQPEEAKIILENLHASAAKIPPEDFRQGLEVELEHGVRFPDANVTNNHPLLTGKIVLAHFKETPDYYRLLDVAEAQGDLMKATLAGDVEKVRKYSVKLREAQQILNEAELTKLKVQG